MRHRFAIRVVGVVGGIAGNVLGRRSFGKITDPACIAAHERKASGLPGKPIDDVEDRCAAGPVTDGAPRYALAWTKCWVGARHQGSRSLVAAVHRAIVAGREDGR